MSSIHNAVYGYDRISKHFYNVTIIICYVNVLREGNVQRSLLKTIRKRQMEFLGHVCRRRGLEFLSFTGKVEGKQRITFLDSLCNSATGGQSKGLHFFKLSDDRDVWRGMVANVCSRSGT